MRRFFSLVILIALKACASVLTPNEIVSGTVVSSSASPPAPISSPVLFATDTPVPTLETIEKDSGLKYQDLIVGTGTEVVNGDTIAVHYIGWLEDGTQIVSSRETQHPFEFFVGCGLVVAGWDEGVLGMRVGGIRKLIIPPNLGYGEKGVPPTIPPNTITVFEVELLEIIVAGSATPVICSISPSSQNPR